MVTVRNHARERLEAGELALGVGLRQARTVDIGRIMKTAGYDFLFIDMEHNSMSIDLAAQISIAAQDAGITPVVARSLLERVAGLVDLVVPVRGSALTVGATRPDAHAAPGFLRSLCSSIRVPGVATVEEQLRLIHDEVMPAFA